MNSLCNSKIDVERPLFRLFKSISSFYEVIWHLLPIETNIQSLELGLNRRFAQTIHFTVRTVRHQKKQTRQSFKSPQKLVQMDRQFLILFYEILSFC